MRVDEAGEGRLPAPVENRLPGQRGVAVAADEVFFRASEDDRPVLDPEGRVPDAAEAPLRRSGARGGPFGRRELGEVPDGCLQPGSPSRFFGR